MPAPSPVQAAPAETRAEAAARKRREAALLAAAEAEIEAGLGIEDAALEAWLDRLESDPAAPLPVAGAAGRAG